MRKRPISIVIFSICMLGVTFSLPLQAIYLHDFENVLQSLTWLNFIVMGLCAASALATYKVHKSFRYLLLLAILAVGFNNWWVGQVGLHFNSADTGVASVAFLLLCSVLLERKAFKVLCNPKLKWWDVSLRSKIEIPVSLSPVLRGEPLTKKSFDISESGFYVQGLAREELERLNVGEKFNVCLNFSRILKIRCAAKVVRKCTGYGVYPTGVGLQFEKIDSQVRATIRRLSQEKLEARA